MLTLRRGKRPAVADTPGTSIAQQSRQFLESSGFLGSSRRKSAGIVSLVYGKSNKPV
jgi:hypothetical protein